MQGKRTTPATDDDEQPAEHGPRSTLAETRLTRKPVADRFGVSVFKVRSMEGKDLHPQVVDGVHYFDPDEVDSVARALDLRRRVASGSRGEGEIAALAFRAFDSGHDLREIVEKLAVPPDRVRALYREWREPGLEEHEVARRKCERAKAQRLWEEKEQRREESEAARFDRDLARFSK